MSDVARLPDRRSGAGWTPAFEGQRPPFEPGNTLAVRHGAYSTLKLQPRAEELAGELAEVVPAGSPADAVTVRLLALVLARIEAASNALDDVGPGEVPRLRADLLGWVNAARRLAGDLGMSPTSRARLGLDLARTGDELRRYLDERYPEGERAPG